MELCMRTSNDTTTGIIVVTNEHSDSAFATPSNGQIVQSVCPCEQQISCETYGLQVAVLSTSARSPALTWVTIGDPFGPSQQSISKQRIPEISKGKGAQQLRQLKLTVRDNRTTGICRYLAGADVGIHCYC